MTRNQETWEQKHLKGKGEDSKPNWNELVWRPHQSRLPHSKKGNKIGQLQVEDSLHVKQQEYGIKFRPVCSAACLGR